ncbi:o-succinylbenzoate--CoA ligase [Heyndrickxia oleronia]|jgi:O-succinylbenzoic acid--CoA ligase|uniref:o-succinylbenzoate--CoA ligase n=1 Tax=Heyndrickxia oleronia TaxID=38875 RepID=UPI00071755C2|nr:o-succinylbenzoate--CoA ligase [Heyndrickxia oleronia]MCI1592184.1 o-succinylbenzoate--CoA ligase [Heyndrickxia oleronia]MCI1612706.1 o-succinylbenzoate--CoA ligase [Heyndrickxia oleronia]MCI1744036.1 o-succinylbenzoate--CoA ligase [Heyndrickxia oleronia]MCI1760750.1 o-succinylbenzoate--CoA ligase [Heyndrickxia oleronia]
MEQLPNFLNQRAFLTPNRLALVFDNQRWSFIEMYRTVETLAQKIATLGIQAKDSVAILLTNRPHTVFIIHALQQLGVSAVFLNHRLTAKEMVFQLKDSGTRLLISEDAFKEKMNGIKGLFHELTMTTIVEIDHLETKKVPLVNEFVLDEVCSIMYTSGTTGNPKGVLQSYGNHWWSAVGSALNLGLTEKDGWLCAVPLFHISGLSILMRSVIYGMPVYLYEQFNEKTINQVLQAGEVTIMSVVSTMLYRLIDDLGDKRYHSNFRCMLLGGGPAPKPLLDACLEKNIPVFQSYGMTETSSQIVTLAPEDSIVKLGSAGKPLFPSQLKIMNNQMQLLPNQPGEIVVKGPNVTKGYLNREEANKKNFKEGWFYTGDIGYVDEDGYLFVMDRRSDLIISGGENIYPAEIEEVLLSHSVVKEAGVVGIEHTQWGQVPYAFVVVSEPVNEADLVNYCMDKLAKFKIPHHIYFVNELPRNASNKLLRRKLHELMPKGELG